MKFVLVTVGLGAVLVALFFAGLFGANTPLLLLGFCPFTLFVYPLIWIGLYRFFTEVYELVPRGRQTAKPTRPKTADLGANLEAR